MSTQSAPYLSLANVRFSYGDHTALEGVSLEVLPGEAVALVGPNGCGKSTALRLCVGLDLPDSGELRAFGELVDRASMGDDRFAKRLRQRVGFVFQDADVQLFCPTVADEVAFGPRQMGLAPDEVERRVRDCLALMGIESLAGRPPYQLSGGERKRVAVACVVSMAPDVLLLDEPTNALDEEGTERLLVFLRSYVAAGHSVVIATHHHEHVDALNARVVRMDASHRTVS